LNRTVSLKVIKYENPPPGFIPNPIQYVISSILKNAPLVSDRLSPPLSPSASPSSTNQHRFINKNDTKDFVFFEFCGFNPGITPSHIDLDHFPNPSVNIDTSPLFDTSNHPRILTKTHHVCGFGEILIIESGLGPRIIERYLNEMILKYYKSPYPYPYPKLRLKDIISKDIVLEVKKGGGIREVKMGLTHGLDLSAGRRFQTLLGETKSKIGGTQDLTISWKNGKGQLSTSDAVEAYSEISELSEEENDEGNVIIKLTLNNGSVFDLENYKIRTSLIIDEENGHPKFDSFQKTIEEYLNQLRKPQGNEGKRVLTDEGKLTPLE